MADLQKFLNQAGVSVLWNQVVAEVSKVDTKVATNTADITTMKGQIEALEQGAYDDTEIRGLIGDNADAIAENVLAIATNTAAIGTLNGTAETTGSVANTVALEIAKVVANAPEDFDTLKEIADWIANDTTGAAGMANDISALKAKLEGVDTTVVAYVAAAIEAALKIEGVDKYALASELDALADKVSDLEEAGYQNAEQVGAAIDAKITALDLPNTYDAKGAAAQALTNAQTYTDTEIAKIIPLTEEEILAAINGTNTTE